jgi:hypothetical protein
MPIKMQQDEYIPADYEWIEGYTATSIVLHVITNMNSGNIKLKQIEGMPTHYEVLERRNEYSKWKSIGLMRKDLYDSLLAI